MTVNEYLSKDFIKWFHVNSAQHDCQILNFAVVVFFWWIDINIITKNLQKLIIHDFLKKWGVRRPSAMWQGYEGSRPVVCNMWIKYFVYFALLLLEILVLEFFQNDYIFFLYSSTFSVSTLCFISRSFFVRNKTFTSLQFSSTFYTSGCCTNISHFQKSAHTPKFLRTQTTKN